MSGRSLTRRKAAALSETACILALITTLVIGLGAGRWMSTAQRLMNRTATHGSLDVSTTSSSGASADLASQNRPNVAQIRS